MEIKHIIHPSNCIHLHGPSSSNVDVTWREIERFFLSYSSSSSTLEIKFSKIRKLPSSPIRVSLSKPVNHWNATVLRIKNTGIPTSSLKDSWMYQITHIQTMHICYCNYQWDFKSKIPNPSLLRLFAPGKHLWSYLLHCPSSITNNAIAPALCRKRSIKCRRKQTKKFHTWAIRAFSAKGTMPLTQTAMRPLIRLLFSSSM